MSIILIVNLKHSTAPAIKNKINTIPAEAWTTGLYLSIVFTVGMFLIIFSVWRQVSGDDKNTPFI